MLNSSLVQRILDNNEDGRGGMGGERKSFARDSSARARRKGGGRGLAGKPESSGKELIE